MKEEMRYSELQFRLSKAVGDKSPISDITTVMTTDLQGSQVSAGKIIEQLGSYKNKREAIQKNAQSYYELFLKTGASIGVVEQNYKNALLTGEVTTEAVGNKLNQLQAKAIAQTTVTVGLIAALTYYSADIDRKIREKKSGNPFRALGEIAKLEASALAVRKLSSELNETKQELHDLKAYAADARKLLDHIYAHGPVLKDQNSKINGLLTELSDIAKTSMLARAQTDEEIEKFVLAQDTKARELLAANTIPVLAE
jgi:hypothetical protein